MTRPVAAHITRSALPLLALSALGLMLSGCGRSHTPVTTPDAAAPHPALHARDGSAPATQAEAYAGESKAADLAAPSAPRSEAAGASADRAYEPAPAKERPGLGTEWGETRESRVSSAPFEREAWNTPLSTSSLFYNDEAGVSAMLGREGAQRQQRTDGISAGRGAVTIRVVDSSGAPLPTVAAGGRSYVVGDDGQRYAIRIENRTGARFEAIATVDGLDVIDGQSGSFEKRGYLVGPWATVEIDGFRQSNDAVAAFRFGRVRDSYAAKRGNDRNVGVIGIAIFQERGSAWPWNQRELERRDGADAFPGRFAPPPPRY